MRSWPPDARLTPGLAEPMFGKRFLFEKHLMMSLGTYQTSRLVPVQAVVMIRRQITLVISQEERP